ncbi:MULTISPECIES: hypothetical protein [Desulfosporosinus]|uniref:Uncharacterized protein n=2 Tax=Desulfosporosinus TaxID=79206 RepID=A0A1M5YEG7_9FIRM|nr:MULTISPECIES: hypothetical protein [Desulfosporosinus]MDA8221321.1 hypothetical protein [Desulfitobacterium hafniense]MCO1600823.1 hypothetical protein [Desulfosporosinus nitroreducens]MCO5384660.1 hypothetical protein [Desulfosporosinus sp.]MDO0825570.1 hypothetical protein [Desulfosporosinus nitroreducens]SHI09913.1 hypothetical protein SAMN02746098_02456 [Desulfosporosinus lacus DSM 15449]
MIEKYHEFQSDSSLLHQYRFQVGDRVETCSHCIGTVVRIECDEMGVFIIVHLDILPGEFAYDPYDLEIVR